MIDADLVLEVHDATQVAAGSDLLGDPAPRRRIVVLNKIDLLGSKPRPQSPAGLDVGVEVIETCATTGQGLDELLAAIARRLVPEVPPAGAAVPVTDEQVERLSVARGLLAAGEVNQAHAILLALLAPVAP